MSCHDRSHYLRIDWANARPKYVITNIRYNRPYSDPLPVVHALCAHIVVVVVAGRIVIAAAAAGWLS